MATVFASLQVKQEVEQDALRQFGFSCDQITLKIQERLGAYALILRGGAALFAGSETVDRQEWRAYVEGLRPQETVPGVQGIGFAQIIPRDQLATHVARIRGDGFPEYSVRPSGERAIYTSIIYLEPFRDRNLRAFGFDMFFEPVRRAAMEQARDSGKPSLSGKVELVQETSADMQAGTLMYVPVYRNGAAANTVEQKRSALIGWVYSPYRMNDLMGGILANWMRQEGKVVDLHIYDGPQEAPASLLFDSIADRAVGLNSLFHQQRKIDFNGQQWLLVFDLVSNGSGFSYAPAWFALIGGLVLSMLLWALMFSVINTQANAVRIAEDLTEKIRKNEELLRASEERWKFAIEGSGDGVWDWNLPTGEATFSRRWKEMLGWAESEIGNSAEEWVKRVCPEDLPGVMANIQAHLDQKTAATAVEFRMLTKEGSWKWILGRGIVVSRDADGKPLRLVGTNTDITERKQTEAARAELEAQLRESQKMEALGTMAGGVAHDFNNALAAILGNIELARQDVGPGHPALVSLEEIGKASRRAKDLVQQILAFSRRQKLERKPTSLSLVVVESERMIRATLPVGVSLHVACKADTPAVLADATQVKQVLLNLCANAVQAVQNQGRPGVVDIELSAHEETKDNAPGDLPTGRYACLTVRDNGPGMDRATCLRIFEPFFTTKPKGKGTGLGLAVVHGIVQAHEGRVKVESTLGEGSAFRVCFPAIDMLVQDVSTPTAEVPPVRGSGRHVLYIDDEEAIVFLMKRLLERQGFRVSGYTDQREALEAVRANADQFDLAVTDYNMPGMSGLEVAQVLREIRPDLPVVLASGYITEELRAQAPAAGIRELIYKPNTVDDLCEAVARLAQSSGDKVRPS